MKLKIWMACLGLGLGQQAVQAQGRTTEPKCLFGDTVGTLLENKKDFKVKESAFQTLKLARRGGGSSNQLVMADVSVVEDRATKRVFHVNTTYNHIDDGDNSWGWIEEVTGAEESPKRLDNGRDDPRWRAVVAEISDSDIFKCSFTKR
jgi:hypothetical protein